jgi:genome maintenance exonuclease 1
LKTSTKTFEHLTSLTFPILTDEIVEGTGRIYTTPEGNRYPSVTTVIGAAADKTYLEDWKKRVGEEEARRVSAQATRRGTAVHSLVENYLLNNPTYSKGHMPNNIMSFRKIQPHLDAHLGRIAGLEVPLYSNKLRVAGRVDCIAEWDGVWSIVDFKTSKREKARDDIHDYFIQCSAYSLMMFELTGILCKQSVILMTVDDGHSLVFKESTREWLPKFIEIREKVKL